VEEGKDTYPAKEIETNYDVSYNRNAVRMEGREGGRKRRREEEKERKRGWAENKKSNQTI